MEVKHDDILALRVYAEAVSSFNVRIVIYIQYGNDYFDFLVENKQNTVNELMTYVRGALMWRTQFHHSNQ